MHHLQKQADGIIYDDTRNLGTVNAKAPEQSNSRTGFAVKLGRVFGACASILVFCWACAWAHMQELRRVCSGIQNENVSERVHVWYMYCGFGNLDKNYGS